MTATTQKPIRVFFLTLTHDERERLNDPETGGWDSEPKFSRYASATCNADPVVIESAFRHGDYVHAATINQIDRPMNQDDAYFYTQNISEAWTTHEHVECHTDFPRSMMVGDLVEIDDEFFACAPCGWTKIDINAHMEGELRKQCHDCGDRLEDRDTRIVDLRDEVEPAGFVFLCPSCEHERIRKEEETVTCGACSVAIGAHTMDENCRESKAFHFYATCVFGWATSTESVDDAIEKLAQRFRPDVQRIIRGEKKQGNDGMYFWSCRVLAPSDAPYKIEWFQPVGVETVDHQEHAVTRCTLKTVEHHVTKSTIEGV